MKDLGVLRLYLADGYDTGKIIIEVADLNSDSVINMKCLGILSRYIFWRYEIKLVR